MRRKARNILKLALLISSVMFVYYFLVLDKDAQYANSLRNKADAFDYHNKHNEKKEAAQVW